MVTAGPTPCRREIVDAMVAATSPRRRLSKSSRAIDSCPRFLSHIALENFPHVEITGRRASPRAWGDVALAAGRYMHAAAESAFHAETFTFIIYYHRMRIIISFSMRRPPMRSPRLFRHFGTLLKSK